MRDFKLSLLFITFVVSSATAQSTSTIPMKLARNRSMITVKVDKYIIPDILLDTGFAFDGLMIYNPDYNDSLKFPNAMQVKIPGAGGGEPSIALMLDSAKFNIGNLELSNQRLLILQSDTYKGFPTNGIIGYSLFGHYATEINFDDNTMTLHELDQFNPESGWKSVPIYFKKNKIPWIDVSVVIDREDPVLISTYIDFAAAENIELLEKENMKFVIPENLVDKHLGRGLSGDIEGKAGKISKLIIGPYELNNREAAVVSAEIRSKQDNADAVIGSGSLRNFNLIFDYLHKKLYLKPNRNYRKRAANDGCPDEN